MKSKLAKKFFTFGITKNINMKLKPVKKLKGLVVSIKDGVPKVLNWGIIKYGEMVYIGGKYIYIGINKISVLLASLFSLHFCLVFVTSFFFLLNSSISWALPPLIGKQQMCWFKAIHKTPSLLREMVSLCKPQDDFDRALIDFVLNDEAYFKEVVSVVHKIVLSDGNYSSFSNDDKSKLINLVDYAKRTPGHPPSFNNISSYSCVNDTTAHLKGGQKTCNSSNAGIESKGVSASSEHKEQVNNGISTRPPTNNIVKDDGLVDTNSKSHSNTSHEIFHSSRFDDFFTFCTNNQEILIFSFACFTFVGGIYYLYFYISKDELLKKDKTDDTLKDGLDGHMDTTGEASKVFKSNDGLYDIYESSNHFFLYVTNHWFQVLILLVLLISQIADYRPKKGGINDGVGQQNDVIYLGPSKAEPSPQVNTNKVVDSTELLQNNTANKP
jgi:hypothetical protein